MSVGIKSRGRDEIQLYKWSLSVRQSEGEAWEDRQVQSFIYSQLSSMIEGQAIHKFVAYSGVLEDSEDAILVSFTRIHGIWLEADYLALGTLAKSNIFNQQR